MPYRLFTVMMISLLALVGCREVTAPISVDDVNITVETEPNPPEVGEGAIIVTLTTDDGDPITDATVSLRGDMTHAGMTPELAETSDNAGGLYRLDFNWSMAGEWLVDVEVALPNSEVARERFEYTLEGKMNMDDMDTNSDMGDMGDMEATEEMDMSGSGGNENAEVDSSD